MHNGNAMLISKGMNAAINEQIGHELGASNQYVAIATYFDGEGLPALARHFYKQAEEEREHAMKFVKYLVDADADVVLPAVPAPKAKFTSAADAVKTSLDHEMMVTRQINDLMSLAMKENDYISRNLLEWFVQEQLEEVSSMDTLLRMVKRAGEPGLLFVEQYLNGGGSGGMSHADGGDDD
jgi:ferritin